MNRTDIFPITIESAMTARLPAGASFFSSTSAFHHRRLTWSSEEVYGHHIGSQRRNGRGVCDMPGKKFQRSNGGFFSKTLRNKGIRAATEHLDSASDPGKSNYHPFEEIVDSISKSGEDARLTDAETARTVIEVNSKASLMFNGMIDGVIHENIVWPDVPFVTDEDGNVYFQVEKDQDILQNLTVDNNFLQVIIGFDTTALLKELESSGSSDTVFGIGDFEVDDDEDDDDEDDEDDEEDVDDDDAEWITDLEDEDDESDLEDEDDDESLGDWAKLETMRYSHPMSFAKKLAEVVSNDPVDWMEQSPAALTIQGLLRPTLIEEQSDIKKRVSSNNNRFATDDKNEKAVEDIVEEDIISGQRHEKGLSENGSTGSGSEIDEIPTKEATFFKLEMIQIQLTSADGNQVDVELEDYQKAQPDAIAHAASKIITRFKDGGEKTFEAFKSLCWRCKGIQVEEATLIGVDSLGFNLRVCSETQIQTLRFAFNAKATSEYSAERQLNDLLYPRTHQQEQKHKQAHQNEA